MKLLLIRHGQTAWNREQVFRGGHDVELDEVGRKQAALLAQRLKGEDIGAIYSGPLKRARDTAAAVAQTCNLEVNVHHGLDDMRFGNWEGMAHTEVARRFPQEYNVWRTEPWRAAIPGGTTLQQIDLRAWGCLEEIREKHQGPNTVVLVTHRVVLKLLILRMLGLGPEGFWRIKLSPCSLSLFDWDGEKFVMELFNDVCHLREMDSRLMDF